MSPLCAVRDVGTSGLHDPKAGFWAERDQWLICAPSGTHKDLSAQLKAKLGYVVSVTGQSGAWGVFEITSVRILDTCDLVRKIIAGDVQRAMIHQLGCFVIRRTADDHEAVLGPAPWLGRCIMP